MCRETPSLTSPACKTWCSPTALHNEPLMAGMAPQSPPAHPLLPTFSGLRKSLLAFGISEPYSGMDCALLQNTTAKGH